MNESQRRAYDALGLGPRWHARAGLPGQGGAARADELHASALWVDAAQPDAAQQSVAHQNIAQQSVVHQDIAHQDVVHQDVMHQDVMHQDVMHQDVVQQNAAHRNVVQPDVARPSALLPSATPPDVLPSDALPLDAPLPDAPLPDALPPHALPIDPAPEAVQPAPPAATGVAAMGWDDLRQAVAACRACGLCKTRTQTVFGVGNTQARWLLVGEAPGAEEDRRGEPFVGAAGKLLDSMLAALDLTRERDVYIANVLKCRPPQNRNPSPDEVAHCDPFLRRQVSLIDPGLIIVMGRFAAQSLLQTEASIASLRGRVHRYANGERSIPVIVTYHPAYLLRNLPDKARAWADLCLARRTVPAR